MSPPIHRISLIGFGAFERATLESFVRMSEQRARRAAANAAGTAAAPQGYTQVADPQAAALVLIDGDDGEAVQRAASWPGRCVSIGGRGDLPGAIGHLARPINMVRLLELLDRLAAPRTQLLEQQEQQQAQPVTPREHQPQGSTAIDAPSPASAPAAVALALSAPPTLTPTAEILVVDDSDIALRFMARCLARHGLEVQLARSGEEALQRVAEGRYAFVFLDVTMEGIDGYQTCKLIKKRPYPAGRRAPRVVMLTSRGGMVDKMRGTLAGCDAYLTKPLQQDRLLELIGPWLGSSRTAEAAPDTPSGLNAIPPATQRSS